MKYFKYCYECAASFGLYSDRALLNRRVVFGFLLLAIIVFLDGMFIVRVATSFSEYINSAFNTLASTVTSIMFAFLVIKILKIFEILSLCEEISKNRK